jgi:hypothetical protein
MEKGTAAAFERNPFGYVGSMLPTGTRVSVAALLQQMNSYYSNLIEGHQTHPRDIERALKGD